MNLKTGDNMKTFIGTKTIEAEPCKAWKQSGEHAIGTEGYKVKYEDGYISWSPKDAFEKAYRPADTFKDRLIIELENLSQKTEKLEQALIDEKVPEEEVGVLFSQLAVMRSYIMILEFRLEKISD
jgi:predicted nucleotidyltransferase